MTIYLLFPDADTAQTEMVAAGYKLSEYNDHFETDLAWLQNYCESVAELGVDDPNLPWGWGTLRAGTNGHEVNVYDAPRVPAQLAQFISAEPLTPNNIRAGDDLQLVFRTVIVTAAIRDTARAMVVAMAGDTHAQMWSQGLSADGQAPATHYINSGLVRVELAQMLDDANVLAAGTGITLEQAQYILSQCDVSDDQPEAAMDRLNLTLHSWSE